MFYHQSMIMAETIRKESRSADRWHNDYVVEPNKPPPRIPPRKNKAERSTKELMREIQQSSVVLGYDWDYKPSKLPGIHPKPNFCDTTGYFSPNNFGFSPSPLPSDPAYEAKRPHSAAPSAGRLSRTPSQHSLRPQSAQAPAYATPPASGRRTPLRPLTASSQTRERQMQTGSIANGLARAPSAGSLRSRPPTPMSARSGSLNQTGSTMADSWTAPSEVKPLDMSTVTKGSTKENETPKHTRPSSALTPHTKWEMTNFLDQTQKWPAPVRSHSPFYNYPPPPPRTPKEAPSYTNVQLYSSVRNASDLLRSASVA